MNSNSLLGWCLLALLLGAPLAAADVQVLTADNVTLSTRGITNPTSAYGRFDGTVATTTNVYRATGDVVEMTLSNYNATGTLLDVNFTIRMNSTGNFVDDSIDIQYSNDSGNTWFTAITGQRPPGALTNYGNYSVTASFQNPASLNNTMVRLWYVLAGGRDNTRSGIDGVEMHVTYAPPPTVTLGTPGDNVVLTNATVSFNFTPQSQTTFLNCSIYINGTLNTSNQTPITSNALNTINITLADGSYTWNVTCYDKGGYAATAASANAFKVDTTAPVVTLLTPANHNITSVNYNQFNFSVSDASAISSCDLIVDNTVTNTYPNTPKGMMVSTNATLTIGDHWWHINCTDEHGFTGTVASRNISVRVTTPTVVSNLASYDLGDTVSYVGSNWQTGATVAINVTYPNGSVLTLLAPVNATGQINATQYLNYSDPLGTYFVKATQTNDSSRNASTQYAVSHTVTITADQATYGQGETVTLTGSGFSPFSTVNLSIKYPGAENNTEVSADGGGGFAYSYPLSFSQTIGDYNVSGFDEAFPMLAANTTFAVTERVATLTTNKSVYVANETARISGDNFSPIATILWQIYYTLTGAMGAGFPKTLTANSGGDFNATWDVNHTCSGNYTVLATDQNTSNVANTTFLINNTLSQRAVALPDSVTGNRVTPSLALVNTSNDQRQPAGVTATNQWGYLEFTFHPAVPSHAWSINTTFTIEQRRTVNRAINYQVYYVNASGPTLVTGCAGALSSTDTANTCDLSSYTTNGTIASDVRVRVNYTTAQAVDAEVDAVNLTVNWTGDPSGCTAFGSTPMAPTIAGPQAPSAAVILNAGARRSVQCNFTITDGNGAADILGGNATFYTAPAGSSSADANTSHYTNTTCEQVSSGANSKTYRCTAALLYYAYNGTWTCNVTGRSTDGTVSNTASFTVDPLYALNITATLMDFRDVGAGELSSNITQNFTNAGNQPINITAYGYGGSPGDGNSFSCPNEMNLTGAIRFAPNTTATYAEKEPLTGTPKPLRLKALPQTSPTVLLNYSYWQMSVPQLFNNLGQCNGTIIFEATPS